MVARPGMSPALVVNREDVKTVEEIRLRVRRIMRFLELYGWLADAYVSDFFVLDLWHKLPSLWQMCLTEMSPAEHTSLLNWKNSNWKRVLPLSLLAFRCCVHSLCLERTPIDLSDSHALEEIFGQLNDYGNPHPTALHSLSMVAHSDCQGNLSEVKNSHNWMPSHCYRRHMKPKKQHEIDQLAKTVSLVCEHSQCNHVVDVGAGLGHLSRMLNFEYDLKVTTIEAAGDHRPKAEKYDRELEREMRKKAKLEASPKMSPGVACDGSAMEFKEMQNQNRLPNHVVYVIEPNISSNDFLSMINQAVHSTNMDSDDSLRTKYGAPGNSSSTLENCLSGSPTSNSIKTVQEMQCFLHSDKHCRKKLSDASCLSKINTMVTQNENSRNVPTEKFLNIGHATHWNYVKGTKECMKHSNLLQDTCRTLASQPNIDTLVMCGLHACGDLSATMLRIFAACSQAVALTLVGCCYMKLTCLQTKETASSCGYPLSHYICGFSHCLSYEALEMACHFVDAYCQRLKDEMPSLRRHCYRAAVQIILIRLDPNFKNDCIRLTVKKAEELSFSTYAELCLKRFGMAETIPTAILEEAEANLCRWKDVVSFYTVRLCLAPVVETLILLDRLLHLHEKGISCALLPIFDPKLSPRNFLLLAVKKRVVD